MYILVKFSHRDRYNLTCVLHSLVYHDFDISVSLSVCSVAKSCLTLSVTPRTVACQASLSMGFPRHKYWGELHFHLQDFTNPGFIQIHICLTGRFFTTEPPGKPISILYSCLNYYPLYLSLASFLPSPHLSF